MKLTFRNTRLHTGTGGKYGPRILSLGGRGSGQGILNQIIHT